MTVDTIKKQIVPILKKEGVTRAAIFGSFARGEQTKKSDIDILIDIPKHMSLFGFIGLEHQLTDALDIKVDLIDAAGIKPRIKPYILKDQIAIL